MPHLPTRLSKLMALAASAAFAALLFSGSGEAQAGYYQPSYRYYAPNYGYQDYPAYGGYGYRGYGNGHAEIRELQRLFPSTNWPPSMRYYSQ
jgi:hypothetical protein